MAKKKKVNVVYSTNPDFNFESDEEASVETLPNHQQNLRVILDKKKRAGKQVTVVYNFIGKEDDLKALGKLLKSRCGVGGAVKDDEILIQGDLRKKVIEVLVKEGYKVKQVGG